MSSVRLVSYNILDGGTGRLEPLIKVLERQRPDVIGLAEADDVDLVQEMAEKLGMDFVVARGQKKGAALLSRFEIRQSINHALAGEGFSRSCVEGVIALPSKILLPVAVVHLHSRGYDADEVIREQECRALLDAMATYRDRGMPHLLCGDFNANAPSQQIDPERVKPKTRKAIEANGGDLPRRAVQSLLVAGYVDTLPAACGVAAHTMTSFTTEHPGQRVDYIFAWGAAPSAVRSAWIETGSPAAKASDHFPVGVEIDWS